MAPAQRRTRLQGLLNPTSRQVARGDGPLDVPRVGAVTDRHDLGSGDLAEHLRARQHVEGLDHGVARQGHGYAAFRREVFPLRADLAASTLASGAYALLSIFTVALLCKISLRYAIPALWLLGPTKAAGDLAGCLGEVTAMALPKDLPPAGGTALLVTVCVPLLAWAYMAFATSDDTSGTWGVTAGPSAAPDQGASVQTCAALARSFGLTRREEDVLALLLEGASATDIAAGLVVSEATARSHIQHIYQKLSVHSRDELLRFCGEREG